MDESGKPDMENLDIHGVKDLARASRRWHKVFWAFAITLALVAFSIQLAEVMIEFIDDNKSTLERPYIPEQMPGLMVCPQFRTIPSKDEISDDMYEYLLGYLPLTQVAEQVHDMNVTFNDEKAIAAAKAVLAKYNNSISALFIKNSYDTSTIFKSILSFPNMADDARTTAVAFNLHGICYYVKLLVDLDKIMIDYAFLQPVLLANETGRFSKFPDYLYDVYVGDQQSLGVQMGIRDYKRIDRNTYNGIKVRVKKKIRYPGRNGGRCEYHTRSEYNHKFLKVCNQIGCPDAADCKTYVPGTENLPELTHDNYCNAYRSVFCSFRVGIDDELQRKVREELSIPCEDYSYELEVTVRPYDVTQIGLSMDNEAFSSMVIEYPIMTTAGFLSSIGGTTGLWFGASVLALCQGALFLSAQAIGKWAKRKKITGNT